MLGSEADVVTRPSSDELVADVQLLRSAAGALRNAIAFIDLLSCCAERPEARPKVQHRPQLTQRRAARTRPALSSEQGGWIANFQTGLVK